MEKYCRAGHVTDDNMGMRIACLLPKATDTTLRYVILIDFPLQRRLQQSGSVLRYTYIACHIDRIILKY